MEYKYKDVEKVTAKKDFEIFRHNDEGELVGVVTVPKGCKGAVESMGCSSATNFKISYDVLFTEGDKEISVGIYEDDFEIFLEND